MKKLAVFLLFFLFLLSGCKEKPVTQVYLPVDSEENLDSAAASETSPSKTASNSASQGTVSSKASSKNPVSSKPSSVASSKSAVSSADSSKAEEAARKELLQKKKKEKEAIELLYQEIKASLDNEISVVKSKLMEQEAQVKESESELKKCETSLEQFETLLGVGHSRAEEDLKEKIAQEKDRLNLLQKEKDELVNEKTALEESLSALQKEYQESIFLISAEILALS